MDGELRPLMHYYELLSRANKKQKGETSGIK